MLADAFYISDRTLNYVHNFLGIKPEQRLTSSELKPGKYVLGMEFTRQKSGKFNESLGTAKLFVNDKEVAQAEIRTQAGKFTLSGDGLCIGRDSGDNVSQEYKSPAAFKGGKILRVEVSVGEDSYLDLEKEAVGAFARD